MSLKLSKYHISFPKDTTQMERSEKLLLFSSRTARLMKISAFVYQLLKNGYIDMLPDTLLIKLIENEILVSSDEPEFEFITERHIAIALDIQQHIPHQSLHTLQEEEQRKTHNFSPVANLPAELRYKYSANGVERYFSADMKKLLVEHAPICCECIIFPVCGAKIPKLPGTYRDCPVQINKILTLMAGITS